MRASGYPRRAMFTMIIGAAVNVALDPIFIFVFDMGIKGAAIATDIAMACSAVFVMAHFVRRDVTLSFCRGIYGLRWSVVASIISIGAAPALINAAACFINVIINTTLYRYGGDIAIGAAGIFTTYTSLIVTVILGICQGMQPVIGYNYGARHIHRLKRAFNLSAGVSTLICTAGMAVAMIAPDSIASLFTDDDGLIDVTAKALRTAMTVFLLVGYQVIATAFFQSIGSAWKSIILSLSRQVIFLIPLLLTMPEHFGLTGVWMSFPMSDVCAFSVSASMIIYELKRLKG